MKRANSIKDEKPKEGQVKFHKEGGGAFAVTIDGRRRIIKPGQSFYAHPDEIPAAFRDVVVPVDKSKLEAIEGGTFNALDLDYYAKHHGGGKWAVYNSNDDKQNDEWLSKDEAKALVESLKGT